MIKLINTHENGIVLFGENDEQLTVGSLEAVAALQRQLHEYMEKRGQIAFINSTKAQEAALAEGYMIPITTLNNACRRGTIPFARKRGNHWEMPSTAFAEWYEKWKSKVEKYGGQASAPTGSISLDKQRKQQQKRGKGKTEDNR